MNCIESISILNWNIRGMNNRISRRLLRNMIHTEKPIIIFLQEIKCQTLTDSFKDSIWDSTHEWSTSDAQGLSGGLITSWDTTLLTKVEGQSNHNWIWVRWKHVNNLDATSRHINGINVYGPQNSASKKRMWEELNEILIRYSKEPFCIGGF